MRKGEAKNVQNYIAHTLKSIPLPSKHEKLQFPFGADIIAENITPFSGPVR